MQNIKRLEAEYLRAKIEYYEGTPIMSDAAFDVLEKKLKEAGSKVTEQVGSKRKDFDFEHPHPLKSLDKIQTETINGLTNYQEVSFMKWLNKLSTKIKQTNKNLEYIYYTPKFDGNSLNIIYHNSILEAVLTRGDGKTGKNVTDRFRKHIPQTLGSAGFEITEIRCEAVICNSVFESKYSGEFANARNLVAGIIGKDDFDPEKVGDITLIPLHFIVNGIHYDINNASELTKDFPVFGSPCSTMIKPSKEDYLKSLKKLESIREKFEFPLDGVVFSLPCEFREYLGENDHGPNWAIAIKFVPEESVTSVVGIEWNISKQGELCPVVLLEPVQLAGSIVKRASGYNAGYIITNRIQPGTIVSICKRGDIIPAIQKVIFSPE